MSQFNSLPTYDDPFRKGNANAASWYRFFANLFLGVPATSETSIALTGSPMSYVAPTGGVLIIQGGTVSLVQFSRTQGVNHSTGQTQGCFPVRKGDTLIVNYTGTPNLTWAPQ